MVVVDASASVDTAAVRGTVRAVVDALVDTESMIAIVEFSNSAHLAVGYTTLDGSDGDVDDYLTGFGAEGSSNLEAGLVTATTGSPDLTLVVTDGVANASTAGPEAAVQLAVQQANRIKATGSRIFAMGVGAADATLLAAISGPSAGADVAASDYTVGDAGAVAGRLGALASEACTAEALDIGILAGPSDFPNAGAITITSPATTGAVQPASPYPSSITVSGMTGLVSDVDVHLIGINHGIGQDIDMLLVGPNGQSIVLMSDVPSPGGFPINAGTTITFDDGAATGVPNAVISGNPTYRPTNAGTTGDSFPAPAPAPGTHTTLASAFTGIDANGTWSLYVVDDATGDVGSITGGWSLTITTEEVAEATSTAVVSSPNPSTTGSSVTFTATVTSGGSPVTDGTVTFSEAGTTLGGPVAVNSSGQASFSTTALTEGSHLITATFDGAPGFLTSTGTVTQTVDTPTTTPAEGSWCNTGSISVSNVAGPATPYPSRITVSGAGTFATLVTVQLGSVSHTTPFDFDVLLVGPAGQNLVLMSDVGGNIPAINTTLTFADAAGGAIPAGGPLTTGTFRPSDDDTQSADAPFPAPAPAASAVTELEVFNGTDPNGVWRLFVVDDAGADAGSIGGGWCLNVETAAPTVTALTSSDTTSTFGQAVTFTATVTSGANPVTTGTVDLADGATTLATGLDLNSAGQATFTTSSLGVGSHTITATYNGNTDFQTSADTLTQDVEPAATATALTSSANPSTVGQSVTFTAAVTSDGVPVTTGSVTFVIDSGTGTTVDVSASGTATLTTAALTAGTHVIAAHYGGTTSFAASDETLSQTVNRLDTTSVLESSLNPSIFGQPVTFTATVTNGTDPVTDGSVIFSEDAATLATVALDASGQAAFSTSVLSVGDHDITATYTGTSVFAESDDTVTQTVTNAETSTALTSSLNPSTFGQSVTFTATVTSGTPAVPVTSGTVSFLDGTTTLAAGVALNAQGEATMSTSALAVGNHLLTAVYSGATGLAASTSATLTQVVDGVADAGGPYTIDEGNALALDATGSLAGAGATFSWDVNDDGTFGDATGSTPTLSWAQLEALGIGDGDGVARNVRLQVTDGPTFTAVTALVVNNVAPTATLTNDGPVDEGSTATVTFTAISDPSADDLAALTYSYDFDNDGTFELTASPSPSETVPASFLPNGPATVTVRAVIADDDGGSLELTTDISVTNAAATVTISGPSTAIVGVPVTIKVGADDPSPDDMAGTFSYTVDWGDGTPPVTLPGPADPPVTHTYTDAGTFDVTATVTDPDGATSEPLVFTITVTQQVATTTTTTPTTTTPTSTTAVTSTTDPGGGPAPSTTSTPSTPTSSTTPDQSALPRTGAAPGLGILFALVLIGVGLVTVAASRRDRTSSGIPEPD
jgi:subtilisin-like proprotein convertase family protein